MKDYQTFKGAANKYGWPEYRLRQWCKQGVLPGFFSGSRFYIDCGRLQDQLDTYGRPTGNGTEIGTAAL